jgi:photosystem II stability/assembly factor-like uncharacterized protein
MKNGARPGPFISLVSLPLLVCLLAACADTAAPADAPVASATSAVHTIPPGTHQKTLIPPTWYWGHHDGDSLDGQTAWRTGSDNVFWPSGEGPSGYGESYLETTLSYGPDPAHKRPTAYFRNSLTVLDKAHVRKLYLRVKYDDGFVFYLNGREGGRANMPAGPISFSTYATIGHEAADRLETFDISSQLPNLREGHDNVIAFEVHQADAASSDLVFDAQVIGYYDTPVDVTSQETIRKGSEWHVLDTAASPPAGWNAPGFVDAGWSAGPAPLGFGEDYLATPTAAGHITTYFRKDFTVEGTVHELRGHVMYDDGFVVYLNGHELGRAAMPSGTITPTTLAAGHEAGNAFVDFDWTWAKPYLVRGKNTLAVEVHQASASSSDLVFDLGLDLVGGWQARDSGIEPFQGSGEWSGFALWFFDALHGLASANSSISRTSDGGRTWATGPASETGMDMAVRFVDAQHGWLYGSGGRIQATSDGGATWVAQASGVTDFISDLDFGDAQVGFDLAEHYGPEPERTVVLRTTDGGATWAHTAFALPTDTELRALVFADAQHGWLVGHGYNQGVVYATDDGGLTIHLVASTSADGTDLFDVAQAGASTLVAVGQRYLSGYHEVIQVSHDAGVSWSAAPASRNDACLRVVELTDAQRGWAGGCLGGIVHTEDGGATWTVQRAATDDFWPSPGEIYSLHMVDGNLGFAGDEYGYIIATSTGGK